MNAKVRAEKDKMLLTELGGLRQVVRFLKGLDHEDFCAVEERKGCDCGRNLSIEQVRAAIRTGKI